LAKVGRVTKEAKVAKVAEKKKERSIPPEGRLAEEIRNVLQKKGRVESQEELAGLVLRRLRKENRKFSLSPIRVKRVALLIPEIQIRAKTKRTHRLAKIDACPVCENEIMPLKMKNLLNKKITVGYKCAKCGYQSDLEAFVPMKYIFILKQR